MAAVVTTTTETKRNAIFTDSRYKLQTSNQLSSQWQSFISGEKNVPKLTEWLKDILPASKIGFDPRFSSISQVEGWQAALKDTAIELIEILDNPVDQVWNSTGLRPAPSTDPIWKMNLSGETTTTKIKQLRTCMAKKGTCTSCRDFGQSRLNLSRKPRPSYAFSDTSR